MKLRAQHFHPQSAFTMVEVAISLAIISVALLAIIGVLPIGMNTQRDNREDTIINQDATIFIEDISKGARGADDLTNYVYAIVNTGLNPPVGYINKSLADQMNFSEAASFPSVPANQWSSILTNGANIVGLLSKPEFPNYPNTDPSNHIIACVRSISGPAVEKPLQDNSILVGDSFNYRIFCVNAPFASANPNPALQANLHELRLTFEWPQLPNGNVGGVRQTYRTMIGGQLATNSTSQNLYFYQPQSFAPPPP